MRFWKNIALFCVGGGSYVGLEFLWRGWSHGSMFLAGGTCFLLLGKLNSISPRLSLLPRCIVGSGIITMVEFLTGLLVNRDYSVWDYRGLPGNYCGQVCLLFSFLWIPLSFGAMKLYDFLDRLLSRNWIAISK